MTRAAGTPVLRPLIASPIHSGKRAVVYCVVYGVHFSPRTLRQPPLFWLTYAEFRRVTDGTRTRDLRSHNPMLYLLSYGHHAQGDSTSERARSKRGVGLCWAGSISPAEELCLLVVALALVDYAEEP